MPHDKAYQQTLIGYVTESYCRLQETLQAMEPADRLEGKAATRMARSIEDLCEHLQLMLLALPDSDRRHSALKIAKAAGDDILAQYQKNGRTLEAARLAGYLGNVDAVREALGIRMAETEITTQKPDSHANGE